MRIVGGSRRGTRLADVGTGDMAARLRPTSDRVRESLFNLLLNGGYGNPVAGARVLDLFAGTGALGLESLSRGADHATFVDDGAKAQKLIAENIRICGAGDACRSLRRDATRLGPCGTTPFSLVFLDPPYGRGLGDAALASAQSGGWLDPDAIVAWEEGTETATPLGFERLDRRRYGDTWITLLRFVG